MKYFKISLVLIITFPFVFTASVNQERALDVAENFYFSKINPDFSDFSVNEVELMSFNNENTFYVIKLFPQGFILVAADDLVMPILGYSFINEYRVESLPIQLEWLFNQYKDEINNLYVNEVAPRVHNSGHLTINSHNISQFENHVRAVCNLEKIETKKLFNAKMINLIGEDILLYRDKKLKENEFFFDYKKKNIKPKRKMGHLTILKD